MYYIRKKSIFILLFILIALSSIMLFFYLPNNTVKFNKNCPLGEVKSDHTEYFKKFIEPDSEFIAYKQLSLSVYQFVSLVKTDKRYYLSVAGNNFNQFPILTKEISRKAGENIFKHRLSTNTQMSMEAGATLQPACIIVGDKRAHNLIIEGLYLDEGELYATIKVDSEMKKLYFSLRALVDEEFKSEIEKIKAAGMTMSKSAMDISELTGTEDEMKIFVERLGKNPFFELMLD